MRIEQGMATWSASTVRPGAASAGANAAATVLIRSRSHPSVPLKLSQIREQRRALLRQRLPIEVDPIGRGDGRRWRRRRRRHCLDELEELDVVVDDLFERVCAVVVKYERGVSDSAKSRYIELVPIIERRRTADKTRLKSAARIGARPTNFPPGRQNPSRGRRRDGHLNLIVRAFRASRVGHGLKAKSGVLGRPRALGQDVVVTNDWKRRGSTVGGDRLGLWHGGRV